MRDDNKLNELFLLRSSKTWNYKRNDPLLEYSLIGTKRL